MAMTRHIFQVNNETLYTLSFCAARCDIAGDLACHFFILIGEVCYLGDRNKEYDVAQLEFGYVTALFRQSEF